VNATRARRNPAAAPITDDDVPRAPEAERSVLGAVMLDPHAIDRAAAILGPDDFHGPSHVAIFSAALRLRKRASAVDPVTVTDDLEKAGELVIAGGPAYIASLLDGVPHSSNVEHYAAIVRDKATRRAIMSRALELAGACRNGHETHEITEAGAALFRDSLAADPAVVRRVRPTAEVAAEYSASVARGKAHRLWTGLGPLDTATQGIAPGEVLTVVARPQVGKSALASQVINNVAAAGEPALFVSLEMPREQAFERLVMQRLGASRLHVEELSRDGWAGLRPDERAAFDALAASVVIVDVGKSAVAELDGAVTEATAILGKPPRLIVIDYLGLLGSGSKNLPLYQRVSEAAVDVHSFAKRHAAAVVLLSQAGRDVDRRRSAGAADLGMDAARDSGQVEEACEFLLTLWRPELDPDLNPEERREVAGQLMGSLVKNRRGPRPLFRLALDVHTLRIADWPEET
jgi:replicative DNA helicase